MRRLIGFLVCGLVGALLLSGPALAQIGSPDKCMAALEKEMGKLEKDMFLRLNKCVDRIEKERVKGSKGSIPNGAKFCEKMLGKTIDVSQGVLAEIGKDKLSKFFAGVTKAAAAKCDNASAGRADLDDMGHFVGGVNAPGTEYDYVKSWLGAQAIHQAWMSQVLANDKTRERLQDAIDAPADLAKAIPATDCTAGGINRPNLCAFHKDHSTGPGGNDYATLTGTFNPICKMKACQLVPGDGSAASTNDSEATVVLKASTIIAPIRGTLFMNTCEPLGNPRIGLNDHILIRGAGHHGIVDADLGGGQTVCVRTYRTSGWCNCSGGPIAVNAKNTLFCQDHVVDPNDPASDACDYTGSGGPKGRADRAKQEECYCADASEFGCGGLNACDESAPLTRCENDSECSGGDICVADGSGGRCHTGTFNGELVKFLASPMDDGDCVLFTTTTLQVVDDGEEGADGVKCTDDDEPAEGGDSRIPLTTGSAQAVIKDGIILQTVAQCDAGRVGDACLEDRNCDTTAAQDGHCDTSGSIRGDLTAGPAVGVAANCGDYKSGYMPLLRLAGAIPVIDGSGLGDLAFAFRFECGDYDPTP